MDFVADLHLHSHYSRAVSKDMNLFTMSNYAKKKGLEILTTGDWTHPVWFREISSLLVEKKEGLYQIKNQISKIKDTNEIANREKGVYFLLSVEIACIYSQGGKSRRIHNLVFVPNLETAEKVNQELIKRGANLSSDGRPIIGLSSKQLLQLILEIDERCMLIPAHIWTPWFGLFGANSGFDSIKEAFEDLSDHVYGIETGLSSDPVMNWSVKELDTRSILSFSDAHSPAKMGREATIFRLEEPSYENILKAIMQPGKTLDSGNSKLEFETGSLKVENPTSILKSQDLASTIKHPASNRVLYTIEFYPEEGKYHYNGHRNCDVYMTPEETKEKGEICPVCHRRITVGVMQRVQDLANEPVQEIVRPNQQGLQWFADVSGKHPLFVKMVPLNEILAESFSSSVSTIKVKAMFDLLCEKFGSEMNVLLKTPIEEIEKMAGERVAEGIKRVRAGNIIIHPGYDNVYGTVKIWNNEKGNIEKSLESARTTPDKEDQLGLGF